MGGIVFVSWVGEELVVIYLWKSFVVIVKITMEVGFWYLWVLCSFKFGGRYRVEGGYY